MQAYRKAFRAGTIVFVGIATAATVLGAQAPPAEKKAPPKMAKPATAAHGIDPDAIKWGPAPPTMPAGASVAVLAGDPAKAGELCIMRLKVPSGYRVAPHTHPTDEYVSVLKGAMLYGMGEKWDDASLKTLTVGAYKITPKEMPHFATFKGESIVEVVGIGPMTIKYVNPDDDPSAKKTATSSK